MRVTAQAPGALTSDVDRCKLTPVGGDIVGQLRALAPGLFSSARKLPPSTCRSQRQCRGAHRHASAIHVACGCTRCMLRYEPPGRTTRSLCDAKGSL